MLTGMIRKRRNVRLSSVISLSVLAVFISLSVFAGRASAIPAFGRKYKTSCATCHEAFPRLNGVGEAFRLNGYKFADDELYIKDEPVEMGDEAYKRVWPKAIWPSDIPGLPPISFVFKSVYEIDLGGTKDANSQFLFPSSAKILGAGSLGDNISFFVELGFDRSGGHGGGHEEESESVTTVTDVAGWLQFEDLLGPENFLNIRVGTVGMQDMGLFMARDHNRISFNPYLYSSWTMPAPAHHFADEMGFDEDEDFEFSGNGFMGHAQPGVEVNGFSRSWRYVIGGVNGNGDEFEDNNSEKDIYFQLAYKIGGVGFDGSGQQETDDGGLSSSESWRDDSIILSAFGYWGTAEVDIHGTDDVTKDEVEFHDKDQFWRLGVGAQSKHGDLAIRGGYVFGYNKNPFGALTSQSVDSHTWFAEAEYFLYPWLIPYGRYEVLMLDLPSGVEGIDSDQDQQRFVVGTKALIRANITAIAEVRIYTKDDSSESQGDRDQVVLGFEAAF